MLLCCGMISIGGYAQKKFEFDSREWAAFPRELQSDKFYYRPDFRINKFPEWGRSLKNPGDVPLLLFRERNASAYVDKVINMPVMKPEIASRMPVFEPDSTVTYTLRIKEIQRNENGEFYRDK